MRVVLNVFHEAANKDELDLCVKEDLDKYLKDNPDGFILVENAKCGKKCDTAEVAISEIAEALEIPVSILGFGKNIDCPALSVGGPTLAIHKDGKIHFEEPADTVAENKKLIFKYFPEAEEIEREES